MRVYVCRVCTVCEWNKLKLRTSTCACAYDLWITLCQRMCHFLFQYVCFCVTPSVCVCVSRRPQPSGLVPWLSDSIWRGANWRGASTSSCFVRTWRPRCWINKSWSSKFCHMSGHVFPSTSWEHSLPRLSNSLTVWLGPCRSRLGRVLQWGWSGDMLVLVYLWVSVTLH